MSGDEDSSNLKPLSLTESQFSPDMPYLEESTQPDLTHDSVFTQQPSDSYHTRYTNISPPESPDPRRSARSTKRAPHVCFGNVYTYSTIIANVVESPKFRQTLCVPCIIPYDELHFPTML